MLRKTYGEMERKELCHGVNPIDRVSGQLKILHTYNAILSGTCCSRILVSMCVFIGNYSHIPAVDWAKESSHFTPPRRYIRVRVTQIWH